jgi:ABC-type spermidine/putrescine transport system permease subunit II
MLGVTLLLLYAPIAQLVASSLNSNALTAAWRGFTLDWYELALRNDEVVDAAWRSLRLAVAVAAAAGVIGTLGAVAVRHHPRSRRLLNTLATARIATPELVLAVGLSVLMPLLGLRFGTLSMWFGHTVLLSAYVLVIVSSRLSGTSIVLEEAAADLGASPLRVVRHAVLPHVMPAVAAALVLVAAFSFDDVLLSSRLGGPNDTTLPVVILSMATRRPTPELDAIGTLVIAAGLASFVLALTVGRLRAGSTRDLLGGGR